MIASAVVLAATSATTNSTSYWLHRRQRLIQTALGTPTLPVRSKPDAIRQLGPAFNTSEGVTEVVWYVEVN